MKIPKAFNRFFFPGQRLSQRIVFAGAWMAVLRVMGRGLGVVRIIILARLLSPEMFGLVGVALLVLELLKTLTQFDFGDALIQHKGDIRKYLDTVWVMQFVRSLLLAGIVFAIAPISASYFNAPNSRPIIQAMALTLIFNGLISTGIIYLYKELQVQKRFIWEMSSIVADLVVSVTAAFILRSAWAIVYGSMASSIVLAAVSFMLHPYRPRLRFEITKAKELFSFGWWALLYSVATYVFVSIDTIFVGRLLGVITLGVYTMAHRIGDLIGQETYDFSKSVVFPTYSKLQDNLANLRLAFATSMEAVAFMTFAATAGILVLAPDFTKIVLGQQWIPAIPAMQILGIGASMYSLINTGGSLFYAIGKPRLRFYVMAAAGLIIVALLYPLTIKFGIMGSALAVLSGNLGGMILLGWLSKSILKFSAREWLRPLVYPLVLSIAFGLSLELATYTIRQSNITEFIIVVCIGGVVFAACSVLLWKLSKSGPIKILNLMRAR